MIQDSRENKTIKEFTDLISWQESHKLVLQIYDITTDFPKEEQFGLTSQIRRSAVSITSNIAEGFGRQGYKEKLQFYYMAQGSVTELKNQLIIAKDVKFISLEKYNEIYEQSCLAHKLLQGLITKTKSFLNHES